MDSCAELLALTPQTAVDEELHAQAASLAGGRPPGDAARAIGDWVRDNVAYVPGSTGVQTSAQEAWQLRKGVCQDITHLTAGLVRAVGIPARVVVARGREYHDVVRSRASTTERPAPPSA